MYFLIGYRLNYRIFDLEVLILGVGFIPFFGLGKQLYWI